MAAFFFLLFVFLVSADKVQPTRHYTGISPVRAHKHSYSARSHANVTAQAQVTTTVMLGLPALPNRAT